MKNSRSILLVALSVLALGLCFATGHPQSAEGSSGHTLGLAPGTARDQREPGGIRTPHPLDVTVGTVTGHVVRIAYVIPSNRTAQSNAVDHLRWAISEYQKWYREQMERNGFGPKTFRYETEADGLTPKVYVVPVSVTDDYLRGDIWGRTINAASAAGIPVWNSRQIWWLASEAHLQAANGSVSGGTALGAGFGSGDDGGVGMIGGDALARFSPTYLTNNASYAGKVIPEIGPYPLVQNVSFPSFEGNTFSSVSSSVFGAGLHELSHAFGLPHNFRNDNNFNGNLMGNGLRGIRGNLFPDRYRTDYTRAAFGTALALSVNRYFNPPRTYTDNTRPALSISTTGTVTPTNGLLEIRFTASDATGLHAAWLQLNGDLVEEMPLYGKGTTTVFRTAFYNPGEANNFAVSVFDTTGNKTSVERSITPASGGNRAPQPFITTSTPNAYVGQAVTLNASSSADPGGNIGSTKVEWDLDGDGTFDTASTTVKTLSHRFASPGNKLVSARLTDAAGAQHVSAPLPVGVVAPGLNASATGSEIRLSWPTLANGFVLYWATNEPVAWSPSPLPVSIVNDRYVVTVTNRGGGSFFRLQR